MKTQGVMRESVGATKKFPKRKFFVRAFGSDISCNEVSATGIRIFGDPNETNFITVFLHAHIIRPCEFTPSANLFIRTESDGKEAKKKTKDWS